MSNSKISALTGATTPLAGTEVLPIVQSSTTKQVSVANLTAGRAISATSVTASTGNFVVGTSGQGIDFSATPGTGTSELLADYEEGTWTPSQGGNVTVIGTFSSSGTYTKIGRCVTVVFSITGSTSISVGASGVATDNLPFTVGNNTGCVGAAYEFISYGSACLAGQNSTIVYTAGAVPAAGTINFTITYFV